MEADLKEGLSDEERTMRLVVELANSVMKGQKFTLDLPEHNKSGRCPMLDLSVWQDTGEAKEGRK